MPPAPISGWEKQAQIDWWNLIHGFCLFVFHILISEGQCKFALVFGWSAQVPLHWFLIGFWKKSRASGVWGGYLLVLMVWEGEGWWKQNFFCFSVYESPKNGKRKKPWLLMVLPALRGSSGRCQRSAAESTAARRGMTAAITWHLAVLGPLIARMGCYLENCRPDVSLAEFLYRVLF